MLNIRERPRRRTLITNPASMPSETEATRLAEDGKKAFAAGRYLAAADSFRAAADRFGAARDQVNAAEQKNNLSVALLQLGRAQEALDTVLGTEQVFADAGDLRRQGIAANNQAAALEALRKMDESLASYERAAKLLGDAGEKDLRAATLKAAAGIQLRRGRLAESGIRMIGVLEAEEHPGIFTRILRGLLRVIQR